MTSVTNGFNQRSAASEVAAEMTDALFAHTNVRVATHEFHEATTDQVRHVGTVATHNIVMSDASAYDFRVFEPHNPVTDIPVSFTPAWFTSIDFGHNYDAAKLLLARGIPSIVVSQQRVGYKDLLHLNGITQIPRDIHVQHQILDLVHTETGTETDQVIMMGFSRGSMVGFGVHALAASYDRTIPYFDYRDPCLAHVLTDGERDPRTIAAYVIKEGVHSIKNVASEVRPRQLLKVIRTMIADLPSNVAAGYSIFSVAAGEFAKHLPPDAIGHVSFYEDSELNHRAEWHDILEAYPHVSDDDENGMHLDGMHPDQWIPAVGRVSLASSMLANSEDLRTMTWTTSPHLAA